MAKLSRKAYSDLYGPTKGDLVRLGDTELLAEIEHDFTTYGHELLIGAGKNLRDGEGIQGITKKRLVTYEVEVDDGGRVAVLMRGRKGASA